MNKLKNLGKSTVAAIGKKKIAVVLLCIVLLALGVGLFLALKSHDEVQRPANVGTEQQAADSEIQRLLSNPIPASQPIEKQTAYYEELASLYSIQKDFPKAIAAMDRRMAIETADMQYDAYIRIAYYYHSINDSENALRFLDLAESKLIKVDRPGIGYSYQDWVQIINELREEYK